MYDSVSVILQKFVYSAIIVLDISISYVTNAKISPRENESCENESPTKLMSDLIIWIHLLYLYYVFNEYVLTF